MTAAEHWDEVYRTKDTAQVSWYERAPSTSLRLVTGAAGGGAVVDIGAGASELVDALLERGHRVTVLDVSAAALAVVRERLGERDDVDRVDQVDQVDRVDQVDYVVADVLAWRPGRTFRVWHDRAVFHFLTAAEDQARYASLAASAVEPGGVAVLATFAPDGPTACSGLPTARHDAAGLAAIFGPAFELVHAEREEHVTPWGAVQPFTWVVLRRR